MLLAGMTEKNQFCKKKRRGGKKPRADGKKSDIQTILGFLLAQFEHF